MIGIRKVDNNFFAVLLVVIVSSLAFIPLIGNCNLFDWDEINFAECAREMLVTGNYTTVQINFQPFWEKPPLYIWLQALSMNLFGVNEFAARFPNAICGVFTLLLIYLVGKKLFTIKFGIIWSFLHLATMLPHLYFKSGIIDPWFNFFILLSCILFFYGTKYEGKRAFWPYTFSAISLSLAVLTKGPAALLIVCLTILAYVLYGRMLVILKTPSFYWFIFLTILGSISWFAYMWFTGKQEIVTAFIDYQVRLFKTADSGHGGPFYYHLLVLLFGCFPSSIFFLKGVVKNTMLNEQQLKFKKVMLSLFFVVLIIFSIVHTKIVHYSSLCYVPLSFVATLAVLDIKTNRSMHSLLKAVFIIVSSVVLSLLLLFSVFAKIKPLIQSSELIEDEFAKQNLQVFLSWHPGYLMVPILFGVSVFFIYKGFFGANFRKLLLGFVIHLFFIQAAIYSFVPKIELVSQRPAIDFYRFVSTQDAYVETHDFKSYAYLFYSAKKPEIEPNTNRSKYIERFYSFQDSTIFKPNYYALANLMWMLEGEIDKPAYVVSKCTSENGLKNYSDLHKLYSLNGFNFYVRKQKPDN